MWNFPKVYLQEILLTNDLLLHKYINKLDYIGGVSLVTDQTE